MCCKQLQLPDIQSVNIYNILALKRAGNGAMVNISGNAGAHKEYDRIFIGAAPVKQNTVLRFKEGRIVIGNFAITASKVCQKNDINFKCKQMFYIDGAKLGNDCVYRFRKHGDVFKRFGGGTKPLSDFFTDIKTPKRIRDSLPLLCSGGNVLILFPVDISDNVKITHNTKEIYKFEYRRIK